MTLPLIRKTKISIPNENLRNLQLYKYSAVDHSVLGHLVMQRFWTVMLRFIPLWMHPNIVTLVGFAFLLLSISPLAYRVILYGEEGPWWGWVLLSFGTFAYQTMDALDGKQARRLGVGSPLGEMVDHGCDALSATIVQFGVSCCLCIPRSDGSRFPLSPYMQSTLCSSLVVMCFFLAMWDQQRTGQFVLGAHDGEPGSCACAHHSECKANYKVVVGFVGGWGLRLVRFKELRGNKPRGIYK